MKFHGEQIGDRFTARIERGPLASAELSSDSFGGLMADLHHAYHRLMRADGTHAPEAPAQADAPEATAQPPQAEPPKAMAEPAHDGWVDDGKFQFAVSGEVGPLPDGEVALDEATHGESHGTREDTADSDTLPPLKDNKPTDDETRAAESELRAKADAAEHTTRRRHR